MSQGTITFNNTSKEYWASLFTVDDTGAENFVADLAPDSSSVQPTEDGQLWIVKAKVTGIKLGMVVGTTGNQVYDILWPREGEGEDEGGSGGGP